MKDRCVGGEVRLDLNESPLPPPRTILEAACGELGRINRYPDPEEYRELEYLLAEYSGVPEGYVAVFNGGDEALNTLFAVFTAKRIKTVSIPRYSFTMYRVLAESWGVRLELLSMRDDGEWWSLDLPPSSASGEAVIIDSPNNPTGSPLLDEADAVEALERGKILVVDEAYYEFSGRSLAGLAEAYSNIIILRTLSKAFALAGLRIGYMIARPETLDRLNARVLPFPISRVSLAIAREALKGRAYIREIVKMVEEARPLYRKALEKAGFKTYNSRTNFVLARAPSSEVVEAVENGCVRIRRTDIGPEWVRVTIAGVRELEVLRKALEGATLD